MTSPEPNSTSDEIARVAHAIWEAEGRPEGRDHEHWMRARQLIAEGRAETEFPGAFAASGGETKAAARPVQPGFEDVPPGIVPDMTEEPDAALQEEPGGRFATQLSELPDGSEDSAPSPRTPSS